VKLENVKWNELSFGHVIRLVREIAVIVVFSYLAIRIFSGDLSLDFTKLTASELVSILLAFFSIALSASFFFAATSASNQFYDNISKFNKDTSELLGRLDEQIKHVNSSQKELGNRIDKQYLIQNGADSDEQSDENEEKINEIQAKWQESLNKILDSATIEPGEKQKLESELREKDNELNVLREDQAKIKAKKIFSIKRYLKKKIDAFGLEEASALSPDELLLIITQKSIPPFRRDLEKYGFTDVERPESRHEITKEGKELVSTVVSSMLEDDS
tara:strand:+ start:1270 stop:2091 length:822 start_codon:yes stop_codon:yes gene_type:complete